MRLYSLLKTITFALIGLFFLTGCGPNYAHFTVPVAVKSADVPYEGKNSVEGTRIIAVSFIQKEETLMNDFKSGGLVNHYFMTDNIMLYSIAKIGIKEGYQYFSIVGPSPISQTGLSFASNDVNELLNIIGRTKPLVSRSVYLNIQTESHIKENDTKFLWPYDSPGIAVKFFKEQPSEYFSISCKELMSAMEAKYPNIKTLRVFNQNGSDNYDGALTLPIVTFKEVMEKSY